MPKEVNNPHDQFFRAAFSRLDVARDFLKNYLPQEISAKFDLKTLEIAQESFADDELKGHHTDFLFRLKLKNGDDAFVFVLLEHKSYADELAAFQLLRYMVRIWEKALREKPEKLPPILPIVFYHGKRKWKVSRNFADLINAPEEFADYVPGFNYHLCDLSEYDGEKLKGEAFIRAAMLAMKNIFGKSLYEQLVEITQLAKLKYEKETMEFVALIVRYFMAVQKELTPEDVRKAVRRAFPKNEEEIMTIAVKEFINQGVEKGIEQGRQSILRINMNILTKKFGTIDSSIKKKIEELSVKQLENLGLSLFDFDEIEDLEIWIEKN